MASTSHLNHVRYHPSIQTPAGPSANTTARRKQRSGAGTVPSPETHQYRDDPVGAGPPRPDQEPANEPSQEAEPEMTSDTSVPRPDQVSFDLDVLVNKHVLEKVEVLTRGQRENPVWFSWRKNRITASVAHDIAHCRYIRGKTQRPPVSYLARIMGKPHPSAPSTRCGEQRRMQTRAMAWGVEKEAEAVLKYQELKNAERHSVSVQDCGLFIDPQRPWLAASPDGIVTDSATGQWLRCLEVKCPYKHRNRRVEDACREDCDFCLEIQDKEHPSSYRLKTSHRYYTQVQCQLAVTGLQEADFVVFTLKETAIVLVTFDSKLWEDTLHRLTKFYRDGILPLLRQTQLLPEM